MHRVLLVVMLGIFMTLTSCARHERPNLGPLDEIDDLLSRLSPYTDWYNGPWQPRPALPRRASTKLLLDACFPPTVWWDTQHVHRYEIILERAVRLRPKSREFIVAVVATDKGRQFVLLSYGRDGGWWSRTLDVGQIESSPVKDTTRWTRVRR